MYDALSKGGCGLNVWNVDLLVGYRHFFDRDSLDEYSYPSHSIHCIHLDRNADPALECDVIAVSLGPRNRGGGGVKK